MPETYTVTEINCQTNESIVREMTEQEIDQHKKDSAESIERQSLREAAAQALADLKASAKAKLIAGEALTAEEADTLVI